MAEPTVIVRPFSAAEAERMGLIGHVVPDGKALDKAREIAGRIAANAPLSVRPIKQSVLESDFVPEKEALALELGFPCFGTDVAREGTRAFAEKWPPISRVAERPGACERPGASEQALGRVAPLPHTPHRAG